MFDNPMATVWPPPEPPKRRLPVSAAWGAAIALCVSVGLVWLASDRPGDRVCVFSSPTRLRQIEVVAAPASAGGETRFFLHDAGYRLPHRPVLLAQAYGVGAWSVDWLGADKVRIGLRKGFLGLVVREPVGVEVVVAPGA